MNFSVAVEGYPSGSRGQFAKLLDRVLPGARVRIPPPPCKVKAVHAPVAQLDRVTDYESVGWRFDPSRAHFLLDISRLSASGGSGALLSALLQEIFYLVLAVAGL